MEGIENEIIFRTNQLNLQERTEDEEVVDKTFTIDEALDSFGFGKFQVMVIIIIGLFSFAEMYELSMVTVIMPAIGCSWKLKDWEVALISSIASAGSIAASAFWGVLGDKLGRWPVLFVGSAIMGYFGLLLAFTPTFKWLLAIRFISGSAIPTIQHTFGLLAELYPVAYRSRSMVCHRLLGSVGGFFQYVTAFLVVPTVGWKWHVVISSLPLLLFFLFLRLIPESPRFLLVHNDVKGAAQVLERIAKTNKVSLPPGKLMPIQKMTESKVGFKQLLSSRYRTTTIIFWIMHFLYFCVFQGCAILTTQVSFIISRTCFPEEVHSGRESCSCHPMTSGDYIAGIISASAHFPEFFLNLVLLDLIGRKKALSLYQCICGSCLLLLNLCTSYIVADVIIFFMKLFLYGSLTALNIFAAEIYPTKFRSLSIGANSVMGFFGTLVAPFITKVVIIKSIPITLGLLAGFLFLNAIIVMFIPEDTKGKTIKEI